MPAQHPAAHSLFDHGNRRLGALCEAVGFSPALRDQTRLLFRRLTAPWGGANPGVLPPWRSDITDDHSPFEFSLAIEGHRPELRILAEAQPREPSPFAQWEAGRELGEALARDHGASLARFHQIEDLFAVRDPRARFGIWHAVNLRDGAPPEFKIYLNPNAQGRERRALVVAQALTRLGRGGEAPALPTGAGSLEDVCYFSLDLSDGDDARIKVYLAPRCATVGDIEAALSTAQSYAPGEATRLCRALAGSDGPYTAMPVQLCFSFTRRGGRRPVAATLYFPVRAYASSDAVARGRILAHLSPEDRPLYERAIDAFAERSLDAGTGMQTYVSYRRHRDATRLTVYLSPELYRVSPRRSALLADPVSGVVKRPDLEESTMEDTKRNARR